MSAWQLLLLGFSVATALWAFVLGGAEVLMERWERRSRIALAKWRAQQPKHWPDRAGGSL